MLSTSVRGAISRNGLWRESFEVVSPFGTIDPAFHDFKLRLWPLHVQGRRHCWDYGWSPGHCGLEADTDDPGRLVFQPTDRGGILTWSFPPSETQRLEPGHYDGAITVRRKDNHTDIAELVAFKRVMPA